MHKYIVDLKKKNHLIIPIYEMIHKILVDHESNRGEPYEPEPIIYGPVEPLTVDVLNSAITVC
jgi:hypothetical protein